MASVIIPHFCSILRFLGRPRPLTRLSALRQGGHSHSPPDSHAHDEYHRAYADCPQTQSARKDPYAYESAADDRKQ